MSFEYKELGNEWNNAPLRLWEVLPPDEFEQWRCARMSRKIFERQEALKRSLVSDASNTWAYSWASANPIPHAHI